MWKKVSDKWLDLSPRSPLELTTLAIIIASSNAGSVTTPNRVPPKSTVDENADSTTFATLPDTQEPEELSSDSEEIDELEDCLLTVSNVITCLYNFSIAIRNPAPRDRLEKCAAIDVSHHEKFDIDHTSNKFPNAAEYLTRRLGEANTKRRQLLKYHELHHNKIAGRRSPEQTQGSYVRARDMPQQYHELEIEGSMYETGTNTETATATTVSTYVPQDSRETNSIFYPIDLDFDSRSEGNISETSFGSNLSSGEFNSLQVPSPPDPESAFGGVPFECPLCWSMIKISNRQSWR